MQRVVITGMGVVCALGLDAQRVWSAMAQGRSGIRPISGIPSVNLRARVAAEVPDFNPAAHFEPKRLPVLDRVSQFALVAAREAVAQASLERSDALGERAAVVVGCGVGGEGTNDEQARKLYGEQSPRLHPLTIVRRMTNAPASHLSIEFGAKGPTFAVASACASANHAMIQALQMVRHGYADVALAGGTEACITYGCLKAWEAMRVLDRETCRPFSLQRQGLVLGEGAAIFVLESLEHARRRGANILAELAGGGVSADAVDLVYPSEMGPASAMSNALADARLLPEDIDYVNAHGTATAANDSTETRAIRRCFSGHADRLAVSSTKSMHGHALGAAGAIELVAVIGALRHGLIPPTINFLDPDPACDLDYVPNSARERPVRAAISNSFAFGGLNAVLALRRAPD